MAKKIDSSLLDKAIIFATKAHKNMERRGKNIPYIVHPLEVVSIIATMTDDQELLAAGALHDVVEDTDVTIEEIEKEFGPRVAELVRSESEVPIPNMKEEDSWVMRKEQAFERLKKASRDGKIVALGDKLSNARAMYLDYQKIGDKLWDRFHVKDPKLHEWHYRGLADALKDLEGMGAYTSFTRIIDELFLYCNQEFKIEDKGNNVVSIRGEFNRQNSLKLEEMLVKGNEYTIDFENVTKINYAGLRTLIRMRNKGIKFFICNASRKVVREFYTTGAYAFISITAKPTSINMNTLTESGDGYTAVSYFSNDNDTMVKIYEPYVPLQKVEREKRVAKETFLLGIPTPLTGQIIKVDNRYGITFERILTKKSYARLLSENPDKYDELAKNFANITKLLHTTKCDTLVFSSQKDIYRRLVNKADYLDDTQKKAVNNFIDSIEDVETCLHGDFHFGNVIRTEDGEDLFIDMADFAYGCPLFDIGVLYLMSTTMDDAQIERLYHCKKELTTKFWKSFVKYYFGVNSENELKEIEDKVKPYAAMITFMFAGLNGPKPWMLELINNWIVAPYKK